jgi:glycosyltransferase involved in cell wall biosynthesis
MNMKTKQHFTILMMGYNSVDWIDKSVQSALLQDYDNFDVIAIDAMTTDGTYKNLKTYEAYENFKLVRNTKRQYQTENTMSGVKMAKKNSVICTLDFDDWLIDDTVLSRLNEIYNDDIWMTYGSYLDFNGESYYVPREFSSYPQAVCESNTFREHQWLASHLRTFRKELFLKIDTNDFIDEKTGEMYEMSGDLSFMLPMLEMSGERQTVVNEFLYAYNKCNPLSDDKVSLVEQVRQAKQIKQRKKYERLITLD